MEKTSTDQTGQGTCPEGCDRGFFPCDHNKIDADGWCTECDTPADEINPRRQCEECL